MNDLATPFQSQNAIQRAWWSRDMKAVFFGAWRGSGAVHEAARERARLRYTRQRVSRRGVYYTVADAE